MTWETMGSQLKFRSSSFTFAGWPVCCLGMMILLKKLMKEVNLDGFKSFRVVSNDMGKHRKPVYICFSSLTIPGWPLFFMEWWFSSRNECSMQFEMVINHFKSFPMIWETMGSQLDICLIFTGRLLCLLKMKYSKNSGRKEYKSIQLKFSF